jgi:serine/threonine protein phosphatase PrpC
MDIEWQWVSAGISHVGNVRKVNEDAYLNCPQRGLWVIADGMGGHDAGAVASASIVDALADIGECASPADFADEVTHRLVRVNRELHAMANANGGNRVIGSTVAILLALPDHCLCLWAGDSRIYRLRGSQLEQLTTDHSEVESLIADGVLERIAIDEYRGTNFITRAVGAEEVLDLERRLVPIRHRDRFLICSDGLYKDLSFSEIAGLMLDGGTAEVCQKLLSQALARHCADNVSLIAVDFEEH